MDSYIDFNLKALHTIEKEVGKIYKSNYVIASTRFDYYCPALIVYDMDTEKYYRYTYFVSNKSGCITVEEVSTPWQY